MKTILLIMLSLLSTAAYSAELVDYKIISSPGEATNIKLGNIGDSQSIEFSAVFGKGYSSHEYNPGLMIILATKDSDKIGFGVGIYSPEATGKFISHFMLRDFDEQGKFSPSKPKILDVTFEEGEEFSISIKNHGNGSYGINVGNESIVKNINAKVDTLSIQVMSVDMVIKKISIEQK